MITDEEIRAEKEMVARTLVDNGYSVDEANEIAFGGDYDIYNDCKDIGDIARWIYLDEAQIVEDLEMADFITVDWYRLAKHLNGNRDMFITDNGYGIVVE